ncbi:DUF4129 domain-containing protein [Paenibacillus sp. PL2-23]|uniref:DUF4129 domain-containing protein n=1 Tax=Paenibacillus sp. PL2-23 TaxID=2100729 RepID=UPI0030FBEF15
MKAAAKAFGTLAKGYVELVFYGPILLASGILLVEHVILTSWLLTLPLLYALPSLLLRDEARLRLLTRLVWLAAIGLAHIQLVAFCVNEKLAWPALAVCGLLGAMFSGRGFAERRAGWTESFSAVHMIVGLAAYIAVQPFKLMVERIGAASELLNAGAVLAVAIFMIMLNHRHLAKETVDARKTSARAASHSLNRKLVSALAACIAFLLLFRSLRDWLEQRVQSLLRYLFGREGEEKPPTPEPTAAPAERPGLPLGESAEPSAFMRVLETIMMYAATIVTAAAAAVLLYWMLKKLLRAAGRLLPRLMARSGGTAQAEDGYVDVVEALSSKKLGRSRGKRKRQSAGRLDGKGLASNAERVRYLYRAWLQQQIEGGYRAKPHLSPRETARDTQAGKPDEGVLGLVGLYELARYGEREPGDDDVEKVQNKMAEKRSKVKAGGRQR